MISSSSHVALRFFDPSPAEDFRFLAFAAAAWAFLRFLMADFLSWTSLNGPDGIGSGLGGRLARFSITSVPRPQSFISKLWSGYVPVYSKGPFKYSSGPLKYSAHSTCSFHSNSR